MSKGSYHQILRSVSILGGASFINIFIGLARTKVAAVLLGPAGVGLIGIFQSLMSTASSVAGLGFGNVGTRQIAEAEGLKNAQAIAAARRALFYGTLILATVGSVAFWAARDILAARVLGSSNFAEPIGWLSLGVALMVAGGSQSALLNGLRRIGDIARVSVISALLSTVLGVAILWLWGHEGIVGFILVTPLCSFVVGHWYVAQLPKVCTRPTPWQMLMEQWRNLVGLGSVFMLAGLVAAFSQLLVRTLIQRELGPEALGNFQASSQISITYLGFVLTAMGADYYPRLTASIKDHVATNRMINEQTEIALLLAGGILLAMMGLAPWVIELLYSNKFTEATGILRWQVIGDVLKIVSWPLGFVLLASGDSRAFLFAELTGFGSFVLLTWVGLPWFGVQAAGIAFFAMYAVCVLVVYWLARFKTGFRWTSRILFYACLLVSACVALAILASAYPLISAFFGVLLSIGWIIHTSKRLSELGAWPGPMKFFNQIRDKIKKN